MAKHHDMNNWRQGIYAAFVPVVGMAMIFLLAYLLSCDKPPEPQTTTHEEALHQINEAFDRGMHYVTSEGAFYYDSTCLPPRPMPPDFLTDLAVVAIEAADSMAAGWELWCVGFASTDTAHVGIRDGVATFRCDFLRDGIFVVLHRGLWIDGTIECALIQSRRVE